MCSAVVLLAVTLGACSRDDGRTLRPPGEGQTDSVVTTTVDPYETFPTAATADPNAFLVTGPWEDGTRIASRHTCDGEDLSPPLAFGNIPAGTVSLAVVIEDMADTNTASGSPATGVGYLWVLANVDPAGAYIDEGDVPPGAAEALNDSGGVAYAGPCPEPEAPAIYRVTAFAVGQMLEIEPGDPADLVVRMLRETSIDVAETTFTYSR